MIFGLFTKLKKQYTRHILKIGLPVAALNTLFAFVNMFLGRTATEQGGLLADGTHHRRTNRSYHLEHLPRLFYSSQCLCSSELCSAANLPCAESLSHHFMDDIYIRIFLHIPFYMLWKRNIFYLCS